jgi:NADPH:quinone reductase-like Zn-dependent oxidoreductase
LQNLLELRELVEAGALTTVIDRRYPLDQIVDAFKHVEGGHKKGNVVVEIV